MLKVFVLFGKKRGFIFYQGFTLPTRKILDNLFSISVVRGGFLLL